MLRKACFKGISQGGFRRRRIVCEKAVLQVKIVSGDSGRVGLSCLMEETIGAESRYRTGLL
jgi:hypothetical protein